MARCASLLRTHRPKPVSAGLGFLPGVLGRIMSKLILVGRIHFSKAVRLRASCPCWLLARDVLSSWRLPVLLDT